MHFGCINKIRISLKVSQSTSPGRMNLECNGIKFSVLSSEGPGDWSTEEVEPGWFSVFTLRGQGNGLHGNRTQMFKVPSSLDHLSCHHVLFFVTGLLVS